VPEEFRAGRMSKGELRRTLGFEVLNEVDGFLKAHDLYEDYAIADLEREQQALDDPERAAGPGLNTELPQALPSTDKSFLVLFFKKELLACPSSSKRTVISTPWTLATLD
jgi:hypothetical protein